MSARFVRCLTVLAAGFAFFAAEARADAAPSGRELLEKQESARRIPSFTSKATLSTSDRGADARSKTFTWWRKLTADGIRFATLTRFSAPANIRNEAILLKERAGGDNEVLLYLPNFKKVRRVESQSQSSSFMGSVLSYADVALPHADDFSAKVLREERCPGADGGDCYVLEVTPSADKVKTATGYSRTIEWVRKDNYVTVGGEFYDAKGALWKKLVASDVRMVDRVNKKFLAHQLRVEDVKTGRVTVLQLGDVKTDAAIPDSVFTEQNLAAEK